ncbi:MAG: PEP-CTERM sorting domain-containing protein [Massilia sp.]
MPEPASLGVVALGAAALPGTRRRRPAWRGRGAAR